MTQEALYQDFITSLLDGNRRKSVSLLNATLNGGRGFLKAYESLFRKALYEIGELWERNKISVADEHLASNTAESLLDEIYPKIVSLDRSSYKVVVACTEGEYHQVGPKMVSHVFESAGWHTFLLGANTPVSDLLNFVVSKKPNVLALSLSIFWHLDNLIEIIEVLHINYPYIDILIGGQAFKNGGSQVVKQYDNVTYIPDLESLRFYLEKYGRN